MTEDGCNMGEITSQEPTDIQSSILNITAQIEMQPRPQVFIPLLNLNKSSETSVVTQSMGNTSLPPVKESQPQHAQQNIQHLGINESSMLQSNPNSLSQSLALENMQRTQELMLLQELGMNYKQIDPVAVSRFHHFIQGAEQYPKTYGGGSRFKNQHRVNNSFRFDSTPILMLQSPQETINYILKQAVGKGNNQKVSQNQVTQYPSNRRRIISQVQSGPRFSHMRNRSTALQNSKIAEIGIKTNVESEKVERKISNNNDLIDDMNSQQNTKIINPNCLEETQIVQTAEIEILGSQILQTSMNADIQDIASGNRMQNFNQFPIIEASKPQTIKGTRQINNLRKSFDSVPAKRNASGIKDLKILKEKRSIAEKSIQNQAPISNMMRQIGQKTKALQQDVKPKQIEKKNVSSSTQISPRLRELSQPKKIPTPQPLNFNRKPSQPLSLVNKTPVTILQQKRKTQTDLSKNRDSKNESKSSNSTSKLGIKPALISKNQITKAKERSTSSQNRNTAQKYQKPIALTELAPFQRRFVIVDMDKYNTWVEKKKEGDPESARLDATLIGEVSMVKPKQSPRRVVINSTRSSQPKKLLKKLSDHSLTKMTKRSFKSRPTTAGGESRIKSKFSVLSRGGISGEIKETSEQEDSPVKIGGSKRPQTAKVSPSKGLLNKSNLHIRSDIQKHLSPVRSHGTNFSPIKSTSGIMKSQSSCKHKSQERKDPFERQGHEQHACARFIFNHTTKQQIIDENRRVVNKLNKEISDLRASIDARKPNLEDEGIQALDVKLDRWNNPKPGGRYEMQSLKYNKQYQQADKDGKVDIVYNMYWHPKKFIQPLDPATRAAIKSPRNSEGSNSHRNKHEQFKSEGSGNNKTDACV